MITNIIFSILSLLCLFVMLLFGSYMNEEMMYEEKNYHKQVLCFVYIVSFFLLACFFANFITF